MLANSEGSMGQNDKKLTAPDGETGMKITALNGETSIVQKRPRVWKIVREMHIIREIKQNWEKKPLIFMAEYHVRCHAAVAMAPQQ